MPSIDRREMLKLQVRPPQSQHSLQLLVRVRPRRRLRVHQAMCHYGRSSNSRFPVPHRAIHSPTSNSLRHSRWAIGAYWWRDSSTAMAGTKSASCQTRWASGATAQAATCRNSPARRENLECGAALAGAHGPVRVRNTHHFAYADGTPFFPFGTTCYAWMHQSEELQQQTLESLRNAPFNKIRMCVFPKSYQYNHNEPALYPV